MTVTLFKQPAPVQPTPAPATSNGADFSLDPYADLTTAQRLIRLRADSQLRAILSRRQSA